MPYLFTCPHCKSQTQVDEEYSEQTGDCFVCGGPIQIPKFAASQGLAGYPEKWRSAWLGSSRRVLVVFAVLSLLFFAAVTWIPSIIKSGAQMSLVREQTASSQNLRKISLALNAYAADNGTYPPRILRDDSGAVLHSWRVLLLPYLGEDDIYSQFDLRLPWSAPVNRRAADRIPSCYLRSSTTQRGLPDVASYYMVYGQGTLQPSSGPLAMEEIVDNPSQTILITEGIPLVPSGLWTEPIDLDIAPMRGRLKTAANVVSGYSVEIGGLGDGGVLVATVDGRTHLLTEEINSDSVIGLLTAVGREPLPDDLLD